MLKRGSNDTKLAQASAFWGRLRGEFAWMHFERVDHFVRETLWSREPLTPVPLTWLRGILQFCVVAAQGFVRDHLLLRAHSLTFLTVLSLVPALALAVSLAKVLGIGDDVELTRQILEQIAAGSPQAVDVILPYVINMKFEQLGALGAGGLLGTTVLTVGAVERSLNAIYGIAKQRPWIRRVPDYLAVLLISPLILGISVSLRAGLESQWLVERFLEVPVFAQAYGRGLEQAATLLLIAGLAFLYWFLPNTRVRLGSALLGGFVAGILFTLTQQLYVGFSIGLFRYEAIFGSVFFLPLLLVWIYLSWGVVLLGAEVAYAHQTRNLYRREVRGTPSGAAARETLGLALALEIARAFRDGGPAWTDDELSDGLDVPVRTVRAVLSELEAAGIVCARTGEDRGGVVQLARPAEPTRLARLPGDPDRCRGFTASGGRSDPRPRSTYRKRRPEPRRPAGGLASSAGSLRALTWTPLRSRPPAA
jgi:membrane protein